MTNIPSDKTYVAPKEPPPERQPPSTEVGLIGWLRHNLFASIPDAISTVVMTALLIWFSYSFLEWAITDAQWEVVFLNLKSLGAGPDFPAEEVWRINLWAYVILFLVMLSVGFWMRIPRWGFVVLGIIAATILIVPIATEPVAEPTIHYYVDADYNIREVQFVAEEGQEIIFRLDPLTDEADYSLANFEGFLENDNQLTNTSWDAYNAAIGLLNRDQLTPSEFDLNIAVQVWDSQNAVIAQSDFTQGDEVVFKWEAPESDWYTVTVVHHAEQPGDNGIALLEIDQLEVFSSTARATEERLERYGEPPEAICRTCNTSVNRTDVRFVGERTVLQWLSLQVAPYFLEIRNFFFIALASSLVGYALGVAGKNHQNDKLMTRLVIGAWLISIPVQGVIIRGWGSEGSTFEALNTSNYGGLFLTIVLSAIGIIASFPIGIGLALGRQSDLPIISLLCTIFIEVIRGVPLITLLFMGRLIVPFIADGLREVDLVIRMTIVLTLFTSAYLAEVIRGGLQIVSKGQVEAAKALGLNAVFTTNLIVLPQALRAVIPAIMGQFISLFKDTSLLTLVGLYEITGAMRRLLSDTATGYSLLQREGYLYIGIIYFIFSYLMAEASRKLEESGAGATRRETL